MFIQLEIYFFVKETFKYPIIMTKQKYFFVFLLMILISGNLSAQCGTGVLNSNSTNVDSCGKNGSITVKYTLTGVTQAMLALYKNGGTLVLTKALNTATGTETLNNLDVGNYQVKLLCASNQGQAYATSNTTIGGSYTPISATVSTSGVCTNFTSGGTIGVNISGGTSPYKILIKKTDNPNFADEPSNYQNVAGNNFSKAVNEFGTYQIRVKDACGNYKTYEQKIVSSQGKVEYIWNPHSICSSNKLKGSFWYTSNPTDQGVIPFPQGGLKLVIRHNNASGQVAYDGTLNSESDTFEYIKNPTEEYYVTTTTRCGDTHSYYVRRRNDDYKPERATIAPSVASVGCGSSQKMTISNNFHNQTYWKYPITIKIKTLQGHQVYAHTSGNQPIRWESSQLNMADYDVEVTDTCSNKTTKRVTNPQNGAIAFSLDMDKTQFIKWRCNNNDPNNPNIEPISQAGTTQVLLAGKGYLPNRPNAIVTIISGPSNRNVQAVYVDKEFWGWNNMRPGRYTVRFTSCGTSNDYQFTVPGNSANFELLKQEISSRVTTDCTGKGSITSKIIYNGGHDYTVELLKVLSGNNTQLVQSNTSGDFTNLAPGTYITRLKILPWCRKAGNNWDPTLNTQDRPYYVYNSKNLVVTGTREQLSVVKKTEIICESQQGKGCAYLDLKGVAPFTITYTKGGSLITMSNQSYSVTICDLNANTNYDITIQDGCGTSITEQINVKNIDRINAENTIHPCYNQDYTLSIPYFAGATYQWANAQGVVLSDTREYKITNYDSSHDGQYTATITWDNCLVRTVTITISGTQCGQTIQNHCFKPAGTGSPALETKHGITSLARAGADNGNWPMVRKGAYTVLESKTKGFVLNRLTTQQKNALNPRKGMMVYDTDLNCLSIYNGTAWECFNKPACP